MPVELTRSTPPAKPEAEKRLTGRHVLFGLIAFFAVIIGVNVVMMVMAIRTMPGTEVKSAYEASQHYNRELDRIAAQDRRGWQVEVALAGVKAGGGPLAVEVRDASGRAVPGLEGSVTFERPADSRFDRKLALGEGEAGRYAAAVPALAPGQWQVLVEMRKAGEVLFVSRRRVELAN